MRLALISLVTLAAALTASVQSGNGEESFFNRRFCTEGGGSREGNGSADCAFDTWQQCMESARGLGRYCTENRFWRGPREQPTTQGKGSSRHR
jgi:hypothetical protein